MQNKDYIAVLKQGLEKKIQLLDRLIQKNILQRQLLEDPELDPDDFDASVTEKAQLIEQLVALDQGFEQVYERAKEELNNNKSEYANDIAKMQKYISEIMAKSTQVQTEERRNHDLILQKFSTVKKQIREVKSGHKAVNQYYRNMMNIQNVDPQFLDRKE